VLGSVLAIGCALAIACAVLCSVVAWRARHELAAGPTIAVAALGLALATLPDLISGVHGAELAHAAAYQTTGGALLTAGFGGLAVGIADRRFRFRRRHLLVLADPALSR
jgi:hypothetical protein